MRDTYWIKEGGAGNVCSKAQKEGLSPSAVLARNRAVNASAGRHWTKYLAHWTDRNTIRSDVQALRNTFEAAGVPIDASLEAALEYAVNALEEQGKAFVVIIAYTYMLPNTLIHYGEAPTIGEGPDYRNTSHKLFLSNGGTIQPDATAGEGGCTFYHPFAWRYAWFDDVFTEPFQLEWVYAGAEVAHFHAGVRFEVKSAGKSPLTFSTMEQYENVVASGFPSKKYYSDNLYFADPIMGVNCSKENTNGDTLAGEASVFFLVEEGWPTVRPVHYRDNGYTYWFRALGAFAISELHKLGISESFGDFIYADPSGATDRPGEEIDPIESCSYVMNRLAAISYGGPNGSLRDRLMDQMQRLGEYPSSVDSLGGFVATSELETTRLFDNIMLSSHVAKDEPYGDYNSNTVYYQHLSNPYNSVQPVSAVTVTSNADRAFYLEASAQFWAIDITATVRSSARKSNAINLFSEEQIYSAIVNSAPLCVRIVGPVTSISWYVGIEKANARAADVVDGHIEIPVLDILVASGFFGMSGEAHAMLDALCSGIAVHFIVNPTNGGWSQPLVEQFIVGEGATLQTGDSPTNSWM